MAESEAQICSDALVLLAAEPIVSLTDDSERARAVARSYPRVRDHVLVRGRWKTALHRQALAEDAVGPIFGVFTRSYTLPADCLRVWATSLDLDEDGMREPWDQEGRKILTDAANVSILYTRRITDVLLFEPGLEQAITFGLAARIAFVITQNRELEAVWKKNALEALWSGLAQTGQVGSRKRYRSSALTEVR